MHEARVIIYIYIYIKRISFAIGQSGQIVFKVSHFIYNPEDVL